MQPKNDKLITPLIICGGPTSGKGVLAALLEGHPDIFCIPMWHDYTAETIASCRELSWQFSSIPQLSQDYADYLFFFKALDTGQGAYQILQIAAQAGYMNFPLDSQQFMPVPFAFSFSSFSKGLFTDLQGTAFTDSPGLFHAIFKNLHAQIWGNTHLPRYGLSAIHTTFFQYEMLSFIYPKAKFLFVKRDILDAFASTVYRSAQSYATSIEEMMQRLYSDATWLSFTKNMLNAEHFAATQPERMIILDFTDLIMNTEQCLRKACAHIGVEYLPIMQQATFLGKPIAQDATGIIHDDPRTFLTKSQLEMLQAYIDWLCLRAEQEILNETKISGQRKTP